MNEELNRCASRQKRFFILHSSFYIQGARRAGFLVAAFFILHSSFFIPRVSAQNFIPQGGEHAPAGNLPGDQTFPQLSIASSGGFIVWQDNATDGNNGLGISAQRLNSSLTQSGAPFRVNAQKTGDQEKPKVSLLNDGRAVFVWQGGKYGFQKIYARFLAPDGSFVARDVLVNTYKGGFQINPAVATLPARANPKRSDAPPVRYSVPPTHHHDRVLRRNHAAAPWPAPANRPRPRTNARAA